MKSKKPMLSELNTFGWISCLPPRAAKTRNLLREYLGQRIVYYNARDPEVLRQARAETAQLESNLWSAVSGPQIAQPSPISAVVLSGMNDVFHSEGYTEAAWRNRVPLAAWICSCISFAFNTKKPI